IPFFSRQWCTTASFRQHEGVTYNLTDKGGNLNEEKDDDNSAACPAAMSVAVRGRGFQGGSYRTRRDRRTGAGQAADADDAGLYSQRNDARSAKGNCRSSGSRSILP